MYSENVYYGNKLNILINKSKNVSYGKVYEVILKLE